jgi:PASTA domain
MRIRLILGVVTGLALVVGALGAGAAEAGTRSGALQALNADAPLARQLTGEATISPLSNATTYNDPVGDGEAGLAPDITTVTFANDDLGTLGMTIATPNFPFFIPGTFMGIFLDVDQNPTTGNSGSDFAIAMDGDTNTIGLGRWNGVTWDFTTPQSTLRGSWNSGAAVTINRSELANTAGMNFWIGASWEGIVDTYYDFAPDAGLPLWNYQVLIAPPPPPPPPPPPEPPPPPTTCRVPKVIGLTLTRARVRIRRAHCSVGRIRRVRSARVGRVIGQSPRAGTIKRSNFPVRLTVGRR